jgi:hypothetical protein
MIRTPRLAPSGFADPFDVLGGHLQFLARLVVEFFGKEAVDAPHVAHRRDENVQQYWSKRTAHGHRAYRLRISLL